MVGCTLGLALLKSNVITPHNLVLVDYHTP
jgi:hypothetical protein